MSADAPGPAWYEPPDDDDCCEKHGLPRPCGECRIDGRIAEAEGREDMRDGDATD